MNFTARFLLVSALLVTPAASFAARAPTYHLQKTISAPGSDGWDYLFVDTRTRRLFISRSTHVDVVNVDSGRLIGTLPGTAGVHGVAVDPKSGHGFTSNGRSNSVTIFDTRTLRKLGETPVGAGPDAIIFEPATRRVFTFNGQGQTATAVDAVTDRVVGTMALPGRPEFAVADGRGHLFDNIEDKNEVVDVDARTMKVEHVWPLGTGDGPSGIAMDTKHRRLFSVCSNGKMVVLNADTGSVVAELTIGNGADACAYDPALGLVFSPNGRDGTMSVFKEVTPDRYMTVQTLPTRPGARTMALDEKTQHIFTVAAQMLPAAPTPGQPRWFRRYVPGSFVVLDFAP